MTLTLRVLGTPDDLVLDSMCAYGPNGATIPVRWSSTNSTIVRNPHDGTIAYMVLRLADIKFDGAWNEHSDGRLDIDAVIAALANSRLSVSAHGRESGDPVEKFVVTEMSLGVSTQSAYGIPIEKPFVTEPMPYCGRTENAESLAEMLAAAMRAYASKPGDGRMFPDYAAKWLDWRGITAAECSGPDNVRKPVFGYIPADGTPNGGPSVKILTDCTVAEFASDVLRYDANGSVSVESLFGVPLTVMRFRNGAVFAGFNPVLPRSATDKNTLVILDSVLEAGTGLVTVQNGRSGRDYTIKMSIPAGYDTKRGPET